MSRWGTGRPRLHSRARPTVVARKCPYKIALQWLLDTHWALWANGLGPSLCVTNQRALQNPSGVYLMSEHEQPPVPDAESESPSGEKKEPKVIKRYTNRKLYDTVESRYVTLDEIAQMIKAGAEVKIIDNRSKEDLTSVTLAQIIFEEEKKRSQMPLGVLREIIRHGGEAVAGFYAEKAGTLAGRLGELKTKTDNLREDFEQRVRGVAGIFRKGEEGAP